MLSNTKMKIFCLDTKQWKLKDYGGFHEPTWVGKLWIWIVSSEKICSSPNFQYCECNLIGNGVFAEVIKLK